MAIATASRLFNNQFTYFSERRRASLERAFSGRTKVFVAVFLGAVIWFLLIESKVIKNYLPYYIVFDTQALKIVFDPALIQNEQDKFREHEILLRLSDVSHMELLEQRNTPQNQAYEWIVNKDVLQLGVHDDQHLVQRYVLALLWFSTTTRKSVWQHDDVEWLSGSHECDWKNRKNQVANLGVLECDSNFEVKSLFLAANNLRGRLPSELIHLSKLVFLDFQNNFLTGEIPSELGDFIDLKYAGFSSNLFRGTVPESFGRLQSMEQLLLHDNRFTGQIPTTICSLFNTGALFNLWSDCRKGDMIICECCTICCAATANCGPRENNYPINEQRTPNTVPGTSTETKIVKSASVEQMMAVGVQSVPGQEQQGLERSHEQQQSVIGSVDQVSIALPQENGLLGSESARTTVEAQSGDTIMIL